MTVAAEVVAAVATMGAARVAEEVVGSSAGVVVAAVGKAARAVA